MTNDKRFDGTIRGEASAVKCVGENTNMVGVLEEGERKVTKQQFKCKFEGSDMEEKRLVDTIVVDGNVRYSKDLGTSKFEGETTDITEQIVEISAINEPLRVRNHRGRTGTLVISTESAEKQENREEGQKEIPSIQNFEGKMKENNVVTKLACQADQNKDNPNYISGTKAVTDCLLTTANDEIRSVGDVREIDVLGDVEIIESGKNRDTRVTARTAILESDAEIRDDDTAHLKLEDRRHRMRRGEKEL